MLCNKKPPQWESLCTTKSSPHSPQLEKACVQQWRPNTAKKINLKKNLLKDINIRHDTIKLLEENIGKTFSYINYTNVLLGHSPKSIEIKGKINKWDLINLTSKRKKNHPCTAKETINKTKRQPMDWEKIFANDATNKCLISKIHKQLIQLNNKKTTQSKNRQKI